MTSPEDIVLEGVVSVQAALRARNRPIQAIYVDRERRDPRVRSLLKDAARGDVPVRFLRRSHIDALAQGSSHGGVLASVGPRSYCHLEDLVTSRNNPFIVMLDGVEDPFNFGYAIRVLYAAGADGLVVRQRTWESAAGIVARASAGASELIHTAMVASPHEAIEAFRARGLAIGVTLQGDGAQSIFAADLTLPLFLLIGGERRGIQRSFRQAADLFLTVPYNRGFPQSLSTVATAAIVSFEVMRQRHRSADLPPEFRYGQRLSSIPTAIGGWPSGSVETPAFYRSA